MTLIFLGGQDLNEGVFERERTAGREVLRKAVESKKAEAELEDVTGAAICTDNKRADDTARRKSVSLSVGLIGIGMVRGRKGIDKDMSSMEESGEGERGGVRWIVEGLGEIFAGSL